MPDNTGFIDEVRRLNVVMHEDDETITAVAPCPTASHRPAMVMPEYVVRFACPHGESSNVFCGPCTADRRAGVFACQAWESGQPPPYPDCPGARAVEVRTLHPVTRRKAAL